MDPMVAVIWGACALFFGFALLALFGRPVRSRVIAARAAMVGFACLASFCFWKGFQLRRSAGPVYYDLPSAPGDHRVTLAKQGLSPGYRVRLVRRTDRAFDKDLSAKLAPCGWSITVCEKLALSVYRFENDVIEFDSELPDVNLAYKSVPEMQPLLEAAAVELRCPSAFHKPMAQWLSVLNSRIAFFLGGLVLAALGASVQRRKLRAQATAGNSGGPTS